MIEATSTLFFSIGVIIALLIIIGRILSRILDELKTKK